MVLRHLFSWFWMVPLTPPFQVFPVLGSTPDISFPLPVPVAHTPLRAVFSVKSPTCVLFWVSICHALVLIVLLCGYTPYIFFERYTNSHIYTLSLSPSSVDCGDTFPTDQGLWTKLQGQCGQFDRGLHLHPGNLPHRELPSASLRVVVGIALNCGGGSAMWWHWGPFWAEAWVCKAVRHVHRVVCAELLSITDCSTTVHNSASSCFSCEFKSHRIPSVFQGSPCPCVALDSLVPPDLLSQQSVLIEVHLLGAFLAFIVGLAYFWLQLWLTYKTEPSLDRSWVGPIRALLCTICTALIVASILLWVCGVGGRGGLLFP